MVCALVVASYAVPVHVVIAETEPSPVEHPKSTPAELILAKVEEQPKALEDPPQIYTNSANEDPALKDKELSAAEADPKSADAVVPENGKKPEDQSSSSDDFDSKDLETQSSVWERWSTPVASAWPAIIPTYNVAWAPPTSYYYPSVHYPRSYWPNYSGHGGWW